MAGHTRSYVLDVSEFLFRLTTESLRLRSNTTMRFESVASLVAERLSGDLTFEHHDIETLREHLRAIPTKGPHRIHLTVSKPNADLLVASKKWLATRLASSVTVGDAYSVLLFDFIAEHHAQRILAKVFADGGTPSPGDPSSNETKTSG